MKNATFALALLSTFWCSSVEASNRYEEMMSNTPNEVKRYLSSKKIDLDDLLIIEKGLSGKTTVIEHASHKPHSLTLFSHPAEKPKTLCWINQLSRSLEQEEVDNALQGLKEELLNNRDLQKPLYLILSDIELAPSTDRSSIVAGIKELLRATQHRPLKIELNWSFLHAYKSSPVFADAVLEALQTEGNLRSLVLNVPYSVAFLKSLNRVIMAQRELDDISLGQAKSFSPHALQIKWGVPAEQSDYDMHINVVRDLVALLSYKAHPTHLGLGSTFTYKSEGLLTDLVHRRARQEVKLLPLAECASGLLAELSKISLGLKSSSFNALEEAEENFYMSFGLEIFFGKNQ